jgi:DNA-binding response OmpR family regulator
MLGQTVMDRISPHPLHVAISDTDTGFVQVLRKRLQAANITFNVVRGPAPADALMPMRANVLVIDPVVFGHDAWVQLEEICVRLPSLAVIVCTGRTSVGQRVRGLRLGVDDWITKPCHPEEVIARAEAVLRRGQQRTTRDAEPVVVGEVEIRADLFQAFVRGTSGEFTRREFELLQLLAGARGQVIPREEIYERVWGYSMAHGDRSVDVFIRKLRLKLDKLSPRWRYIHTHFGIGYRLAAEPVDDGSFTASSPAVHDSVTPAPSR